MHAWMASSTLTIPSSPSILKPKPNTKGPNHRHNYNISCNSSNPNPKFDRRDLLISLGGLFGAATASATPVSTPDVNQCHPSTLPDGTKANCCPPPHTAEIIDFHFPPPPQQLRVRPAAHLAAGDAAYTAKLNRAVALMRALPDDDPRSFKQQANVHCAYCDGGYDQTGKDLQVHSSWLFFPFHRYYLYFHERILANLISDPTFSLPYWNWDAPEGMRIPSIYTNPSSALHDPLRDKEHQPPVVVDLNHGTSDPTAAGDQQMQVNLAVMYRQMMSASKTPDLFFGRPYRRGSDPNPGPGLFEVLPHNTVHRWTGDRSKHAENMGNLYSAARDPIFYAHHSNVDRMWSVWKTLGGRRREISDPDFLNSSFLFYDEEARLVRVRVRDCLDPAKLGYTYQEVELPWRNTRPKPRVSTATRKIRTLQRRGLQLRRETPTDTLPARLDRVLKLTVVRPETSRSRKAKEEVEEILVVDGIKFGGDIYVKFDVYVNDDDHEMTTPENTEFAGSFVNLPHKHREEEEKIVTQLRLPITDILEDLDAEEDEHVLVTLVPVTGSDDVTVRDIYIHLDPS